MPDTSIDPRADYQCPACQAGALTAEPLAVNAGIDTGVKAAVGAQSTAAVAARTQSVLRCALCAEAYPVMQVAGTPVPWLYPQPESARERWAGDLAILLANLAAQSAALAEARGRSGLSALARVRLARLQRGRQHQHSQFCALLAPFALSDNQQPTAAGAPPAQPNRSQSLLSYHSNLFRDWNWENGETVHMLESITDILQAAAVPQLGRLLTLGSGAGRLSYDLHCLVGPETSTLLDLNPLLQGVAAAIAAGADIELPEFPIAPLDLESVCLNRVLSAPPDIQRSTAPLRFVLGDCLAPPFAPGSFDSVLTPWLIDILPVPLAQFLPILNRLLPIGGHWLNTGSLVFDSGSPEEALCFEEVEALMGAAGFELKAVTRTRQPYLQSPASAHGRLEMVTTFCAVKRRDVAPAAEPPPGPPAGPPAVDSSAALPRPARYDALAAHHLLRAQVLAAINGERSLQELSVLLGARYNMTAAHAAQIIEDIIREAEY